MCGARCEGWDERSMATERRGEEAPTLRTPQQQPSKGREDGWKNLRKVRKAAVLSSFHDFLRKLETCAREVDQTGFYKHLNTMNLEGKRDRSSAYVKDEDGVLLRDVEHPRTMGRWFHTLLIAKSPKLDPNIADGLQQWPRTCHWEFSPRWRS